MGIVIWRKIDRYISSIVNKTMAALSWVLEEAWKLRQMSAEDYHRAIAISGNNFLFIVDIIPRCKYLKHP